MPQTTEGLQSHLDYWPYGMVKVAGELGNTRSFLRSLQEATIVKLLDTQPLEVTRDMSPIEILQRYNRDLDDRGILDDDDVAYHKTGTAFTTTVGQTCPYRTTCDWLYEDGIPLPCFRAVAMGELLRLVAHHAFDARLTRFGVPCHLTFKRVAIEEDDDGD